MRIGDLLDLVYRDKRIRQRIATAQKFAVAFAISAVIGAGITGVLFTLKPGKKALTNLKKGAVNAMDAIKDTAENKAHAVQVTAAHIAEEAGDTVKKVHGEITGVQKDIADGCHDIKRGVHKTAENIADTIRK